MCNSFEGSSGSFSKENHDLFQNRRRTAEFPVLWNPILKDAIPFLFCKVFGWCAIAFPKFSLPLFFSSDSKNNANCSLLEREETAAAHFPSVPFLLISSLFLALLGSLRRAERCYVNLLCIFWSSNQCEIVLQNVLLQRTLAANLFPGWLYLPADVGYPISL